MPDEVITAPVQHSGGARAAAVFLSAHVLQLNNFGDDVSDDFKNGASSFATRRAVKFTQTANTCLCGRSSG
jgi:hypothetical protein